MECATLPGFVSGIEPSPNDRRCRWSEMLYSRWGVLYWATQIRCGGVFLWSLTGV